VSGILAIFGKRGNGVEKSDKLSSADAMLSSINGALLTLVYFLIFVVLSLLLLLI
jgi:hypothetical protein